MHNPFKTSRGVPQPYGATVHLEGVNFALFSKHADHVSLCLYQPGEKNPITEIPLDPKIHRTGDVWHLFVHNFPNDYCYNYRVAGPFLPQLGHRFDNRMALLDPYAKRIVSPSSWGQNRLSQTAYSYPAFAHSDDPFDWGEDIRPRIPLRDLIIYEMHVRGFTQDKSSGVQAPGSFLGMIEKIQHLKSMGINAIELMPIFEFNEVENILCTPQCTERRLYNYWGYSTINFFSPMNRYGTGCKNTLTEFKMLVKELHSHGIEVILDVVYNHTAEGNEQGPTLSYKGLENSVYYMLGHHGEYYNFSGCGNTLNCNHPVVRDLIRSSLHYWVKETHIDGFRFDLASILVRSQEGTPLPVPPLIEAISQDPLLADTKLIAEAWDAGGLYQVGSFPALGRWAEWNGRYRDDVRTFMKGGANSCGSFATRISGSQDLYGEDRLPSHSINFITSHDGFSLADLVSYNKKHNLANGENNCDGDNNNLSWNCGCEGATEDPHILALRERQRKNFHVALMISQGVPMLLMGDEYGHTKLGNNNTWSHDSRLNWFQWDTLKTNSAFFRFYTMMIDFRKSHPILTRSRFLGAHDITWHGVEPNKPNWSSDNHLIACSLPDTLNRYTLYIAFNAFDKEIVLHLPRHTHPWRRYVYTFLPSPQDILSANASLPLHSSHFTLAPHSSLILKSHD
jgi:isoamylase